MRSDTTRKAGPPEPGAPWKAPQYEEVRRLIRKHDEIMRDLYARERMCEDCNATLSDKQIREKVVPKDDPAELASSQEKRP